MKNLIMILMLITPFFGVSQNLDSTNTEVLDSNIIKVLDVETDTIIDGEVFVIVEKMPEFPGGMKEMYMFLAKNIYYPREAKEQNIQGKVYVNFVVGKNGVLRDVKIIRGIHKSLDDEALRVIRIMPKWEPGIQRGKKVAVSYNLPISFKLGGDKLPFPSPSKADFNFNAAVKLHEKGKYKMAIKYYSDGIKKDSKHINSYYNRGLCYYKLKIMGLACTDWGKAKELGSQDAENLIKKYCAE
ncbi:MAG: TonB family protein [Flavobacteriales bacterium]|nr:TonB family protein [Flavobacteriales bacterium]